VLDVVERADRLRQDLAAQMIAVKEAETSLSHAELAPQFAEVALMEYKEGVSVQQRVEAEGELALARSELEKARADFRRRTDRLAKFKERSIGSARDLSEEFRLTDELSLVLVRGIALESPIEVKNLRGTAHDPDSRPAGRL
jgi:hypothetical protein